MEHTTIVETHGLTKRYGSGVLAVDSVDMSVRRGEVYGFLGPNGAGKTTTLRMLVGLIRPTSGTATVAGHTPGSPAGLKTIGALIESPGFYPYLSGRENLRVVADLASVSQKRVDEVLDLVELASRAGRKFGTYSTGMKQRLGVAAALLKDPELLILDEPSNGLDPQGIAEMRELVRGVGRGKRTVLLSSHQLNEVEQICDRVGVIVDGKLVAEGSLDELRGRAGLMGGSFAAELLKLPKRWAIRILAIMFVLIVVLLTYVLTYAIYKHPPPNFQQSLPKGTTTADLIRGLYPQNFHRIALSSSTG